MTPLGQLLEEGRAALRLSGREAARRAGISESRWRQVIAGTQPGPNGTRIAANPRPRTVLAMAIAVDVDGREALARAGFTQTADEVAALVADLKAEPQGTGGIHGKEFDLLSEVRRIRGLELPAESRLELIRAIIELYEQAQIDAGAESAATPDSDSTRL